MAGQVTVYCNQPWGLRLRMHGWNTRNDLVMGGGSREVNEASPTGAEVVINGTSSQFGQARKDADGNFVLMINGFAATPNVDKDFWEAWAEQNKDHALLAHNPPLIFAREKAANAEAMAKEMVGVRSGLEPLTPTIQDGTGRVVQSDPRSPRGVSRHEGERAT